MPFLKQGAEISFFFAASILAASTNAPRQIVRRKTTTAWKEGENTCLCRKQLVALPTEVIVVLRYGAIEMYSSLTATVTMLALLLLRLRGDEMKFVPWKGVLLLASPWHVTKLRDLLGHGRTG